MPTDSTDLDAYVEQLLVRDADAHADAIEALAEHGDERVVPHLLEVLVIDAIGNDWEQFGFPEVLRSRDPPRYLDLPEVRWPGVRDALAELAAPNFDSDHAWVEWESWYSQQDIEPLAGFDEWKLRLYESYLPPVGGLLDAEPRNFDLQDVRWGNCDRSFLAALNAPDFLPREDGDYLDDEDTVFGFEIEGTQYAVPREVLFPHELLNVTLDGVPVSLTYCTLCNAPILYDRRVEVDDHDVLTFGSSGMLASGNKVMYDEETETLWDQHAGVPTAGHYLAEQSDLVLDQFAVTQTTYGEWRAEYPDTRVLDPETGYDYDYSHYDDHIGFFRHYWNNEDVVQPGVQQADGELPEKTDVYGLVSADASEVWVIPVDDFDDPLVGTVDGREVVAVRDATGDVAVYEAPPTPVERDGDALVGAEGTAWTVTRNELRAGEATRERIPGRHGLWFAFRTHYDDAHVLR
ncbi:MULTISPECIES: DUF3179 domain-containing (seleno)protein [Halobacterium]|uniref:DUF3179 domain-containing (seleno)protein n=1 Tax=Halobacterium TaxID=2239 RepID=UPI00073F5503|nr:MULTISPECIES: DUF3179 domain-containing (seleno)protein [Halobacterium]MCG1003260.1 DUF3179 domain-containing protein [Halobacterium noricense]